MKTLAIAAVISLPLTALAFPLQAYFTGHSQRITTVSGQYGMKCEYKVRALNGQDQFFWRTFANSTSCPYNIQVE